MAEDMEKTDGCVAKLGKWKDRGKKSKGFAYNDEL